MQQPNTTTTDSSSNHADEASATTSMMIEDRFTNRMRRRTSRIVDNPDTLEEARLAGQCAAERVLQRASFVLQHHHNLNNISSSSLLENPQPPSSLAFVQTSDLLRSATSDIFPNRRSSTNNDIFHSARASLSAFAGDEVNDDDGYGGLDTMPTFDSGVERSGMHFDQDEKHEEGDDDEDSKRSFNPMNPYNYSQKSSERAVLRGSMRGVRESVEARRGRIDSDMSSEIDLTTVTDAFTDFTTKDSDKKSNREREKKKKTKSKKKWGIRMNGKQKKKLDTGDDFVLPSDRSVHEELTEAWMCGVTGQVFPTLEMAEKHEDQQLREIIERMGWASNDEVQSKMAFLASSPDAAIQAQEMAPLVAAESLQKMGVSNKRLRFDSCDSMPNLRSDNELRITEASVDCYKSNGDSNGDKIKPSGIVKQDPPSEYPKDVQISKKTLRRDSCGGVVRFDNSVRTYPMNKTEQNSTQYRSCLGYNNDNGHLDLSASTHDYVVLADEALLDVCMRASPMILTPEERLAELHLTYLSKDKAYYDEIINRAIARRTTPSNRFRSDATDTIRGKIQNKLLDAYQLMKEGDSLNQKDIYHNRKTGKADTSAFIQTRSTMFVNVLVRNSVRVVEHELERLAKQKWEHPEEFDKFTRFQRFQVYAHMNMVKLAGLALASDFTPRRIAIQLSNDIYRLLTPRLKRRGVTIGTEIVYRVGGYFVLAVNVNTVDWARLIKTNNKDLKKRYALWKKEVAKQQKENEEESSVELGVLRQLLVNMVIFVGRLRSLTKYDVIDHFLAWMYYFHWIVYLPACKIAFATPHLGLAIRKFIVSGAIDEICYYVHEKGMEMEIRVLNAEYQAPFMLSALQEIRADGLQLKKKQQETDADEAGTILGPLLGPKIKEDSRPAVEPAGFELPENLEFVGLEVDLPVGYRRLRWAYLSRKSTFITDALWKTESKYEDITVGDWSKHSDCIGEPNPAQTDNIDEFIGAEFEASYLMPKSAFVSANMSYSVNQLIEYNDYCFCVKSRSRNPDVPFGSSFVCLTQVLVVNTGNDTCKLTCSVEAQFPNGPPMVARQIQSGMRAGTAESFVLLGETITKYANAFP